MSDNLERITILLQARDRDFARAMDRNNRLMARLNTQGGRNMAQLQRNVDSRLMQMSASAATFGTNFTRALALGAVTAFTAGVRRSMTNAVGDLSSMGKTARDTGFDVEELQGLMRGFARATRISEADASAALERFNRRIGEAVNGAGPLSTTIDRYGISLRRSNGEMKTQSELLNDVARAIRSASTEQERASIAQAAFGDVGRKMASELAKGPEVLAQMQREAREAGHVIDRDLISRAEDLDDRFDDLGRTVGTFFKVLAVESASFIDGEFAKLQGYLKEVDDAVATSPMAGIFGSDNAAQGVLGEALAAELNRNMALLALLASDLESLSSQFDGLDQSGQTAADALQRVSDRLLEMGETGAAQAIGSISEDMREAIREFQNGETSADQFADTMRALGDDVHDVTSEVGGLDASTLNAIRAEFGGLIGIVDTLTARVRELKAEASGAGTGSATSRRASLNDDMTANQQRRDAAAAQLRAFVGEQERQRSLTVEQIEIEREMDRVRRDAGQAGVAITEAQIEAQARLNVARRGELSGGRGAGGGGGGGRGGSERPDEFARAVEAIRERTASLEAEAAALVLAAGSGREYGNAMNYALQRARLLHAAQQAGLEITPELEQAVDRLADAYARASDEAGNIADQMRQAEIRAEAGAQALTGLFQGIMEGSDGAKRALAQLLLQIAQVRMQQAILSAFPGVSSGLGGLLGFSSGGYTGDGGKHQPAGVVHKGEYVFSKDATQSIGAGNLDAMHRAARGYANGGLVGMAAPLAIGSNAGRNEAPGGSETVLRVELGEGLVAGILSQAQGQSIQITRAGVEAFEKRSLAPGIAKYNTDQRRR